ncbi:YhbY family RNA-binding protein [Verrucomicrobiota bacterium sgz303538]
MSISLSNAQKRELKARAQRLEPTIRLGHGGVSESFLKGLDEALTLHELVKVKFTDFKEEKKTLAPQIAEKTSSELIMRVGNVAVFFRPKPAGE